MKRIIQTLAGITIAVAATPSFANNWLWQLDQIKVDQQRHTTIAAKEQDRVAVTKADNAKYIPAKQDDKLAATSPAK